MRNQSCSRVWFVFGVGSVQSWSGLFAISFTFQVLSLLVFLNVILVPQPAQFNYPVWESGLSDYFDRQYIWQGINDGFDIGWIDGKEPTYVETPRLKTTREDEWDIAQWIVERHASGVLLGPFTDDTCPFDDVHYSPLFTVPKPDLKKRIVAHLSYPRWGVSVNDCISEDAKAVQYILFREVCKFVYDLGYDARLWVVDAKDAYYRVPIKRKYWKYMGIKYMGLIFIFTSLQMGLGSACAIYQRFADAVLYIIRIRHYALFTAIGGAPLIYHYLDDFFGGHPDSIMATYQVLMVYFWFWVLGIPTKWSKLKWPHWIQIILGWLYNTRLMTVSLPKDKQDAYIEMAVKYIRERDKGVVKKQLEKLDGCLQHASVVTFPGKAKLRHLEHALHIETLDYDTKIILSDAAIHELKWWPHALRHMNGIPLEWVFSDPSHYHEVVWTDAALHGEYKEGGMGGCTESGIAYQIDNDDTYLYPVSLYREGVDIKLAEMVASYVMFAYFAPKWRFKNIHLYCDNPTVVSSIANKRAPINRRDLQYYVDRICDLSAEFHFRFWIDRIHGDDNVLADRLSRFKQLYQVGQIDPGKFTYINDTDVLDIVNDSLSALLNFKRVPLNDPK